MLLKSFHDTPFCQSPFLLLLLLAFSSQITCQGGRRRSRTTAASSTATTTLTPRESEVQRAYAYVNLRPNLRNWEAYEPQRTIHPQINGLPVQDGQIMFNAQVFCHVLRPPTGATIGTAFELGDPHIAEDGYPYSDGESEGEEDPISAARLLDALDRANDMPDAIRDLLHAVHTVEVEDGLRLSGPREAAAIAQAAAAATSSPRPEFPGDGVWPPRRNPDDYPTVWRLCRHTKYDDPPGLACRCLAPGTSSVVVCDEQRADRRLWRSALRTYCMRTCYCLVWGTPRIPNEPGAYLVNIQPGANVDTRSGGIVVYFESEKKKPLVIKDPIKNYYGFDWDNPTILVQCMKKCASHADCSPQGGSDCKCVVSTGLVGRLAAQTLFWGACGILRKKDLGRRDAIGPEEKLSVCPCNQTYISEACCFSEIVWEPSDQRFYGQMGQIAELVDAR